MLKLRPWYLITSSEDMIPEYWESEVSEWSDVWPSMVSHNLCSAFNPSKCTHTIVNTHTPAEVGSQCCGTRGVVGGSVPCSRVSPQLWCWRWRESAGYLLPPPTIPARPETRTRNLRFTSPTLYPLGPVFFIAELVQTYPHRYEQMLS